MQRQQPAPEHRICAAIPDYIPPKSGAGQDIFILRGGLQEHPAQPSKRHHTRESMNAFGFPRSESFLLDRGT